MAAYHKTLHTKNCKIEGCRDIIPAKATYCVVHKVDAIQKAHHKSAQKLLASSGLQIIKPKYKKSS